MIKNQAKCFIKDNSHIKKIKCIGTLNKKTIKINKQFKAVVQNSSNESFLKGQIVTSILVFSKFNSKSFSGKVKKFDLNQSIVVKEHRKTNPLLLGNRILGLENFNLFYILQKKSLLKTNLCK